MTIRDVMLIHWLAALLEHLSPSSLFDRLSAGFGDTSAPTGFLVHNNNTSSRTDPVDPTHLNGISRHTCSVLFLFLSFLLRCWKEQRRAWRRKDDGSCPVLKPRGCTGAVRWKVLKTDDFKTTQKKSTRIFPVWRRKQTKKRKEHFPGFPALQGELSHTGIILFHFQKYIFLTFSERYRSSSCKLSEWKRTFLSPHSFHQSHTHSQPVG